MNYYLEDFTEINYRKILKNSVNRYEFITYNRIEEYTDKKEFLLWRHDVDFSIHRAYSLARIENSLGIKATYFLQFSSEYYNIFEKEIKQIIFKIIEWGHDIGLHFDPTTYIIKNKYELEKYLKFEKNILEDLFNINIRVFSFHNPTEEILKNDNFEYADMINTYAKYFKNNIEYCSDSNGYWRFERLEDFLTKEKFANRQVLTHPGWWQKDSMKPFDRMKRCLNGRLEKRMNYYEKNIKKYGRKNVK